MEILKHGNPDAIRIWDSKFGGNVRFVCDRCECEFVANVYKGEVHTNQFDGDSAFCPECGHQTYTRVEG